MNAFNILSDPSRRRILDLLLQGPKPVNYLVQEIGMSQPVVSKHLRILRNAGFVTSEPDRQRRLYSIRAEPLLEVDQWLAPYRRFWSEKLNALEDYLDEPGQKETTDG